jgi:hypothetical protein
MRASHNTSRKTLAACASLGLAVTLTACGQNAAASPPLKTHPPSAKSSAKVLASPSTAVTTPASPQPASPQPAPSQPVSPAPVPPAPATGPQLPGVVADCNSSLRLSVEPAIISLACADYGWGVERMTWASWSGTIATGEGTFWEKLCQPNCAEGKIGTYPVSVTLSAVKASPHGRWFSRLTVTWPGARPPGIIPPGFSLMPPAS